ncbi:apolipoprotein acyltransferase [Escherichia coli]|nr:apolipoprotein acyltransferase [Escherichia coli]
MPPQPKIAVVQVGLYYEKGGSTMRFFQDLLNFLNENEGVDMVVFSENSLYGFKNDYNRALTEQLLSDLKTHNLHQKHAFLLNMYGFKKINNIITMYLFQDDEIVNQKTSLIPFIEKKGLFNSQQDLSSVYFSVDKNIRNKLINFKGNSVKTLVCYDALFPAFHHNENNITIIQSDYNQLNKGAGYFKIKKYGSILSRFSNGINSKLFINIQNYGGTIVMNEDWDINMDLFEKSKEEPFFIVNQ